MAFIPDDKNHNGALPLKDDMSRDPGAQPTRVNRQEAGALLTQVGLPIAAATLAKLACVGGGPPYQVWNNRASYSVAELMAWAESRLGPPLSNTAQRKR